MIKSTDSHLVIDKEKLGDFIYIWVSIVALVFGFLAFMWFEFSSITHRDFIPKVTSPSIVSGNQEVVLEHNNRPDQTDNTIVVYCDLPSLDRIYVLNNKTMTIEQHGCQGLP